MKDEKRARAYIELNMENLAHNVDCIRAVMQPGCELMAVVKAQAYGHGASVTASYLNGLGVRAFAVATIDEGIELRKNGVAGEILILGYTDVDYAGELNYYRLTQTVISYDYACALNARRIPVKVHIKIDTGMHRLGLEAGELAQICGIFGMEYLQVAGMYTHLCCADSRTKEDVRFTQGQIACFYRLAGALAKLGITMPKLHIQSSYGLLNYPKLQCDYARIGIALYGVLSRPGEETALRPELRPVLSLRSKAVLVRRVKKGECVGYSKGFTAQRDSRIAILPVGYADGLPRTLSCGRGSVLIRGRLAPIAGNICMDQTAVDITDVPEAGVGDVATLIGETESGVSADRVAACCGSIANELLSRMGGRLPVVASHNINRQPLLSVV